MIKERALETLNKFSLLEENWDDEGAPPPSESSIERATLFLEWLYAHGIKADSVCSDVLGGIDVYIDDMSGVLKRHIWIYFANDGHDNLLIPSAVYGDKSHSYELTDDSRSGILKICGKLPLDSGA